MSIREVKDETGLQVETGQEIGRRVHPSTGRTMIYMAARPTHGTDIVRRVGTPRSWAISVHT